MKKTLIALIVCLAATLPANSQTLSNNSVTCVPCESLRKALVVKTQKDWLQKQLENSRDTITVLQDVLVAKDSIILVKDSTIGVYKTNEVRYQQVVNNKDSIIIRKDKELKDVKKSLRQAYIFTIVAIAISLTTMLLF